MSFKDFNPHDEDDFKGLFKDTSNHDKSLYLNRAEYTIMVNKDHLDPVDENAKIIVQRSKNV